MKVWRVCMCVCVTAVTSVFLPLTARLCIALDDILFFFFFFCQLHFTFCFHIEFIHFSLSSHSLCLQRDRERQRERMWHGFCFPFDVSDTLHHRTIANPSTGSVYLSQFDFSYVLHGTFISNCSSLWNLFLISFWGIFVKASTDFPLNSLNISIENCEQFSKIVFEFGHAISKYSSQFYWNIICCCNNRGNSQMH